MKDAVKGSHNHVTEMVQEEQKALRIFLHPLRTHQEQAERDGFVMQSEVNIWRSYPLLSKQKKNVDSYPLLHVWQAEEGYNYFFKICLP
jgi:hypothetical protein